MQSLNVVITGGTRGIGRGLALEFLRRGHSVAISGRDAPAVAAAVAELSAGATRSVAGLAVDVGDAAAVQALWDLARSRCAA